MIKLRGLLTAISLMFLVLAGCSSEGGSANGSEESTDEETYTIRIATAMESSNPQMAGYGHFEEIINEEFGDQIEIDYVGGPESIPAFNQGEAISNNTVDMSWNASSYYSELVPEALITNFTELSYEEELERGSIEYLSGIHEEKMNAVLVGRASELPGGNYSIYLADGVEVNSMEDFEGLNIRGTATYQPILEALGAEAISMPGGEIYSSLDKGLIDGFAWAAYSVGDLGVEEMVGSQILPKFNRSDQLVIANQDFWEGLPEDIQEGIQEAVNESYYAMQEDVAELEAEEQATLEENGAELVELEDGDEFVELAKDSSWEWMSTRVDDIEALEEYFRE